MKYVAFLDILGFKNTLKTLGQERSIEYIESYSRIVYQVFSRYNRDDEWQNVEKKINGFVVSDSVVLYTNDTMKESLSDLLDIIVDLCREEFCRNSILIRGAIAKGEFNKIPAVELKNLQKQLIVGDAYVKAYGMEDSFKSIGVRLSDEVYQDVENALINYDIVEESVENEKYYVLRYMNIDYLLNTEGVFHKFISCISPQGSRQASAPAHSIYAQESRQLGHRQLISAPAAKAGHLDDGDLSVLRFFVVQHLGQHLFLIVGGAGGQA